MFKTKEIKAGFLLAIFSLLLIHQILPHQHHEHQSHKTIAHNHIESAHGHKHEHEHSNEENKSSDSHFLDIFLKIHSHGASGAPEYVQTYPVVKKLKTLDLEVLASNTIINNLDLLCFEIENKLQLYSIPDVSYSSHLVRPELRGPPSLG